MADYPADKALFEDETFKGDLKVHFDKIHASGDFQRIIRAVAAEHFGLPVEAFKELPVRGNRFNVSGAIIDVNPARHKLMYVLSTFLLKNAKDNHPKVIGKRFGNSGETISKAIAGINKQLAEEAAQGKTALKDELLILSMKITLRVMETSPAGRQVQLENAMTDAPTRPQGEKPAIKVDPTQVARKG